MAVSYAALQATIDLLDTPAMLLDLDGRIRHANPANARLLGQTADELRGQPIGSILPAELRARTGEFLTSLLEHGRLHGVFPNERPDGSTVLVEVSAGVVRSPEGEPLWILASVRDLAAQLEQLQQLNASAISLLTSPGDDLLVTIVRVARGLVGARYAALGVVEDGRLVRFIPDGMSEAEIAGIERWPDGHGLLGTMVTERRTIRVAEIAADPRRSGFPTGHPPMHSFLGTPIRTRDEVYGHLYFTDKLAAPEFNFVDERLVELFASHAAIAIRDQRQRHALEATVATLQQREADLGAQATILRNVRDSIIVTDMAGQITYWNRGAEAIFGYRADEMIGQTPALLYPDQDVSGLEGALARITAGEDYVGEWLGRRKDGTPVWIDLKTTLMAGVDGDPIGFIGVGHDITARKAAEAEQIAAEEALRRSERNLAEAQRIAHIGSWERDLATGALHWSDESHRIFGIESGTFEGTLEAYLAFVHPDDRSKVAPTRAALEAEPLSASEYRIIRPDGSMRVVHEEAEVVRDAAGIPIRYIGTTQDITERVAAEEERARLEEGLRLNERNLAQAQRIAHIGSWDWDAVMDSLGWSDETCRIFGIEPGTFGGTNEAFLAFVHPDDRARTDEAERAALGGRAPYSLTHRIVRPDGALRIVHQDGEVIPDEAANPVRMVGTVQDITEQVAAEEERARLASAVEQTADSIMIQGIDGTITYVNPSFTRLYGYGSDEVVGRYAGLLNSGHHEASFWAELWASVAAGQVWSGSIVNRRRDGTLIEVEAVISAIRDAEGQLISFVQADRDVTRERALEAQLRQSQKMEAIGQLAGGIAHDFNNLLTAIRGYGELVRRGLPPDDEQNRADIEEVIANADRAAALTRGLLAFSRRQVLSPRVVDPASIIAGIAPLLRRLLGEHIELATSGESDACCVRVDPSQLEQVIVNLAINARDAMPAGGRLTIETAPVELDAEYARTHAEVTPGPYVVLAVSDTGVGMDPGTVAHIFEPFFTTKPAGEGTGLGLATVYGFVTQSGGSIYVYSEPGAGTSFKIYLPRVEASAEPPAETAPAGQPSPTGSETVLLVEDEPAVRAFAARVLGERGYTVLEAPDAAVALALAAAQPGPIELLVTDVVMPGLSGRELAERLAADRPATRVLYLSGYAKKHLGRSGTLAADIAYLPKPFSAEALARAVRQALDARR